MDARLIHHGQPELAALHPLSPPCLRDRPDRDKMVRTTMRWAHAEERGLRNMIEKLALPEIRELLEANDLATLSRRPQSAGSPPTWAGSSPG